jgi:O-antigen/teichoic acid export membrane protein
MIREATWLTAGRLVAALLQAANLILLARAVDPSTFGKVAALMSTLMVVGSVFDLGMGSLLLRERSAGAGASVVRAILRVNSLTNSALFCTSAIALAGLAIVRSDPDLWALLPICLWCVSEKNCQVWLLWAIAEGRTRLQFQSLLMRRGGGVALFLALLPLLQPALAFSVGICLASMVANFFVRRSLGVPQSTRSVSLNKIIKQGRPFYVTSVAAQSRNLDILLVQLVAGAATAGLYAIPARLTSPLRMLPASVAPVVVRHVASGTAQSQRAATRLAALLMAVMVVILGIIAALAGVLLPLALGATYAGAVTPLRVSCVGLIFASAVSLQTAFLQGRGREAWVSYISIPVAIVSLGLIGAGAAVGGASGACVGLSVSFLVHSVLLALASRRDARLQTTHLADADGSIFRPDDGRARLPG